MFFIGSNIAFFVSSMCDNIVNSYAKNSENSTYSRSQEIQEISQDPGLRIILHSEIFQVWDY